MLLVFRPLLIRNILLLTAECILTNRVGNMQISLSLSQPIQHEILKAIINHKVRLGYQETENIIWKN